MGRSGNTSCPCCGYDTVSDDMAQPELCSDCLDAECDPDGGDPRCEREGCDDCAPVAIRGCMSARGGFGAPTRAYVCSVDAATSTLQYAGAAHALRMSRNEAESLLAKLGDARRDYGLEIVAWSEVSP